MFVLEKKLKKNFALKSKSNEKFNFIIKKYDIYRVDIEKTRFSFIYHIWYINFIKFASFMIFFSNSEGKKLKLQIEIFLEKDFFDCMYFLKTDNEIKNKKLKYNNKIAKFEFSRCPSQSFSAIANILRKENGAYYFQAKIGQDKCIIKIKEIKEKVQSIISIWVCKTEFSERKSIENRVNDFFSN